MVNISKYIELFNCATNLCRDAVLHEEVIDFTTNINKKHNAIMKLPENNIYQLLMFLK